MIDIFVHNIMECDSRLSSTHVVDKFVKVIPTGSYGEPVNCVDRTFHLQSMHVLVKQVDNMFESLKNLPGIPTLPEMVTFDGSDTSDLMITSNAGVQCSTTSVGVSTQTELFDMFGYSVDYDKEAALISGIRSLLNNPALSVTRNEGISPPSDLCHHSEWRVNELTEIHAQIRELTANLCTHNSWQSSLSLSETVQKVISNAKEAAFASTDSENELSISPTNILSPPEGNVPLNDANNGRSIVESHFNPNNIEATNKSSFDAVNQIDISLLNNTAPHLLSSVMDVAIENIDVHTAANLVNTSTITRDNKVERFDNTIDIRRALEFQQLKESDGISFNSLNGMSPQADVLKSNCDIQKNSEFCQANKFLLSTFSDLSQLHYDSDFINAKQHKDEERMSCSTIIKHKDGFDEPSGHILGKNNHFIPNSNIHLSETLSHSEVSGEYTEIQGKSHSVINTHSKDNYFYFKSENSNSATNVVSPIEKIAHKKKSIDQPIVSNFCNDSNIQPFQLLTGHIIHSSSLQPNLHLSGQIYKHENEVSNSSASLDSFSRDSVSRVTGNRSEPTIELLPNKDSKDDDFHTLSSVKHRSRRSLNARKESRHSLILLSPVFSAPTFGLNNSVPDPQELIHEFNAESVVPNILNKSSFLKNQEKIKCSLNKQEQFQDKQQSECRNPPLLAGEAGCEFESCQPIPLPALGSSSLRSSSAGHQRKESAQDESLPLCSSELSTPSTVMVVRKRKNFASTASEVISNSPSVSLRKPGVIANIQTVLDCSDTSFHNSSNQEKSFSHLNQSNPQPSTPPEKKKEKNSQLHLLHASPSTKIDPQGFFVLKSDLIDVSVVNETNTSVAIDFSLSVNPLKSNQKTHTEDINCLNQTDLVTSSTQNVSYKKTKNFTDPKTSPRQKEIIEIQNQKFQFKGVIPASPLKLKNSENQKLNQEPIEKTESDLIANLTNSIIHSDEVRKHSIPFAVLSSTSSLLEDPEANAFNSSSQDITIGSADPSLQSEDYSDTRQFYTPFSTSVEVNHNNDDMQQRTNTFHYRDSISSTCHLRLPPVDSVFSSTSDSQLNRNLAVKEDNGLEDSTDKNQKKIKIENSTLSFNTSPIFNPSSSYKIVDHDLEMNKDSFMYQSPNTLKEHLNQVKNEINDSYTVIPRRNSNSLQSELYLDATNSSFNSPCPPALMSFQSSVRNGFFDPANIDRQVIHEDESKKNLQSRHSNARASKNYLKSYEGFKGTSTSTLHSTTHNSPTIRHNKTQNKDAETKRLLNRIPNQPQMNISPIESNSSQLIIDESDQIAIQLSSHLQTQSQNHMHSSQSISILSTTNQSKEQVNRMSNTNNDEQTQPRSSPQIQQPPSTVEKLLCFPPPPSSVVSLSMNAEDLEPSFSSRHEKSISIDNNSNTNDISNNSHSFEAINAAAQIESNSASHNQNTFHPSNALEALSPVTSTAYNVYGPSSSIQKTSNSHQSIVSYSSKDTCIGGQAPASCIGFRLANLASNAAIQLKAFRNDLHQNSTLLKTSESPALPNIGIHNNYAGDKPRISGDNLLHSPIVNEREIHVIIDRRLESATNNSVNLNNTKYTPMHHHAFESRQTINSIKSTEEPSSIASNKAKNILDAIRQSIKREITNPQTISTSPRKTRMSYNSENYHKSINSVHDINSYPISSPLNTFSFDTSSTHRANSGGALKSVGMEENNLGSSVTSSPRIIDLNSRTFSNEYLNKSGSLIHTVDGFDNESELGSIQTKSSTRNMYRIEPPSSSFGQYFSRLKSMDNEMANNGHSFVSSKISNAQLFPTSAPAKPISASPTNPNVMAKRNSEKSHTPSSSRECFGCLCDETENKK